MSTKEKIYSAVAGLTEEEAKKLYALIRIIFSENDGSSDDPKKAFEELEKLKRPFSPPIKDEKEEYYRYMEKKYGALA